MDRAAELARNPARYLLFTVLFNARAYYPVLALVFLDLGLTLDQFVWLNMIWAAAIFLFEVPSGALADTFGRRHLLMAAALLMSIEMLCLLFAPAQGGLLLLGLCIINRLCSGLSEACASGADEALAYDSLPTDNRPQAWDSLLANAMRWRSLGFMVSMIVGGLLYDPSLINQVLPADWQISVALAHRLPITIVFLQALGCLYVSWQMVEPIHSQQGQSLRVAMRLTLNTALWVITHPRALVVVLLGVAMDSIVRNFATINSSYFRLIDIPEWTYGFLGASMGLIWWFVPGIAKAINNRFSMLPSLGITAFATAIGLIALIPAWRLWGLAPAMFLMSTMGLLGFTISRVLHDEADSARRATVLSVKGMIFNLGYGLFSLGFSALLAHFPDQPEGSALRHALLWQAPFFIVVTLALLLWANRYLANAKTTVNAS